MSGESRGCKTELSLPWHLSTVFMKALYNQSVLIRRVHRQGVVLRSPHLVIWKSPVGHQRPNPMA